MQIFGGSRPVSLTTPPAVSPAPVTPGDLATLLRQARTYLHDAPRSGQEIGAKIDEALKVWDATTWAFPIICDVTFDPALFENLRPDSIITHKKPLTFIEIPWAGQGPDALIGSSKFDAIIELTPSKKIRLGELVNEAHRRSRLSPEQWNQLAQAVRDCHLESTLTHMIASEKVAAR